MPLLIPPKKFKVLGTQNTIFVLFLKINNLHTCVDKVSILLTTQIIEKHFEISDVVKVLLQ